ncbi:uncharacterized protein LOC114365037 [Ostrinia furnacalis]|uniref:uncharacterized protein LOC114365037 n=1 Tax=Ostrinia furnacalis TaxID=93504 RepID=UPI00103F0BDB|nr:uncharacterized protein LOC114365037 [Ostrinia furnacalis]
MNLMNGGCLSRFSRVNFWTTPCCKVFLKPSQSASTDPEDRRKAEWNRARPSERLQLKPCANQRIPSTFLLTQVRYKCPPPKLHRDVEFPNFDAYRKEDYTDVRRTTWGSGDAKPGYTYVMGFFGYLCGGYAIKTFAYDLITYMAAPADVLALASIEVDLSKVAPGGCSSYKWRGKPLFIKNRTAADIALEESTPVASLRDPETQEQRCVKPEWLVVIGICTHLGCVPIPNSGDWSGGFYCPCHGSHYDNIGRARKGPAPLNLEVPPYKFISDTLILVG